MIIRTALYVVICFFAQSALADTTADSLIERCRAQSKSKFESGITSTMREGAIEYSGCLEAVILELAEHTYPPEETRDAKKEIRQQLDALSKATIDFYWKLENENNCPRKLIFMHYIIHPIHSVFPIDVDACGVSVSLSNGFYRGQKMLRCNIAHLLYVVCATVGVAKWFLAKCARNAQANLY